MKWEVLDAARKVAGMAGDDNCPAEAITYHQYAKRYKLPLTSAYNECERLVVAGIMKSGKKKISDSRGHICARKVYWMVEVSNVGTRDRSASVRKSRVGSSRT